MSVSDSFFLDKGSQHKLREELASIPRMIGELSVTLTRQARIQRPGLSMSRRPKPESQVPIHIGAHNAADLLHNCLGTWVRLVCEQRAIVWDKGNDIITLAKWLRINMIALALTEGSEEAYEDIKAAIDECWRQIDIPADDDIVIDRGRVHEANRLVVTAGQVEKLANKMGAIGKGLNKRRVETLAARRKNPLRPCAVDGDVKFFRLGDVLDAHHRSDESGKKAG
ncbi:hypothetical protein [Mycobacteroides abscessus]|uniref:hypothetical protein n=1 Tax=Mycobacteroides abscessus TaxID=36809 RepID=UPI000925B977|nr:hypothetical protein [Mycobacteroides abscessus]QSM05156.1 helix-turn-helix DNA binding domain protein [Mycobacterium phage prophiGD102-1]MBN7552961.1 hypothetical protein [Mycobacteroides abscessus subsp. abscessus]MDO3044159.1 hypothetical protein [Mycobacteroides abscessus subsp. abscessus]MDO3135619.1 hypothetical protein [Mycobacteroides abscessus subsp. abscessus]MDO3151089.1 hypothetical protein [Mycobacteroides abscessus subsp. abscessus]